MACFKGTISARINNLQQQFQRIDLISQPDNKQQIQKLNNLESQAWLYQGVLERLGENPAANHEKIAKTIEALEYKRNEVLRELEPRRPRKYRTFAGIQSQTRSLLASQAETDYERLEKLVDNVIIFTRSREPSQNIFSEVIERIAVEITQNANQISPYRLRLAYKIDDFTKILSTKLVLKANGSATDENYQKLIDELQSQMALLAEQFNGLLRSKQENTNNLNRRIQKISNLTQVISNLHRDISDRDTRIAALHRHVDDLIETTQGKQAQVDSLQSSILNLQSDIQDSAEINWRRQNQINDLKKQLSQLNQQKLELQERIQDVNEYARSKESEVKELQDEKSQLSAQKLELQNQYQLLSHQSQQQQNKINALTEQIDSLDQQPTTREEDTRDTISVEDFERIHNQSDYEYVNAYERGDGTPVKGYYRRRRNR